MSPRAINEIVHGKRSITANSALRLAKYFGTSPEFWLNLQTSYDLEEVAKEVDLGNIREFDAALDT
jgi:addiction module HigA family antidote